MRPLIVYPDVCLALGSWLPYKRPRGAPEMTFGKTMIKALKPVDSIDPNSEALACNGCQPYKLEPAQDQMIAVS